MSILERRGALLRIAEAGQQGSPAGIRALARLGNRAPLERRLRSEIAANFVWVRSRDGLHFYRHLRTGRFLNLDEHGNCYSFDGHRGYHTSDFELELARVTLGSDKGPNGTKATGMQAAHHPRDLHSKRLEP